MKDWDEEKLRSVVTQQESKQKTTTDVSHARGGGGVVLINRSFASSSFRPSRIRSMVGCKLNFSNRAWLSS
jgi:hypothetical protein